MLHVYPAPDIANCTPDSPVEALKSASRPLNGVSTGLDQILSNGSSNGDHSNATPRHVEEGTVGTPSEPTIAEELATSEGLAEGAPTPNGSSLHADNLKVTDDEGESTKTKLSKKANKKAKKRKDSMSITT